jgi:predicted GNAT family acetyltransferase
VVTPDPEVLMTARPTTDEAVFDVSEQSRYELRLDGELVGLCDYAPRRGRLVFPHVETRPEFEGRGLATRLVRAALLDVRARGARIEPQCPFVVAFLRSNPDFADLVFVEQPEPLLEGQQRVQ